MNINKYYHFYMQVAELAAQQSVALRSKVGCAIVTASGALFTGFNGTPPGWPSNKCEDKEYMSESDSGGWVDDSEKYYPLTDADGRFKLTTKPEVLHAERNALDKMLAEGVSSNGAVVFCTMLPCSACALALIGAKVSKVVYQDTYRCKKGIDMLTTAGIIVEQYNDRGRIYV